MFNPGMMDPALMSFFKQAGDAFKQTAMAEGAGRMDKALEKRCGSVRPLDPADPNFINRALLYAAKGYAMAHVDGQVTWGGIRTLLDASSAWPPAAGTKAEGYLFQAFVLGFLYGSELPAAKQANIEAMIPMASKLAGDPQALAQQLGISPEKLMEMANNPKVLEWAAKLMGGGKG
jgi:hypothetical protein